MKAITNYAIIKEIKEDGVTDNGIITHLKKDDKRRFGVVKFDATYDFVTEQGNRVKGVVPAGTEIFYELYSGKKFEYEGETLKLIHIFEIKSTYEELERANS